MHYVIYPDSLFVENFILNLFILLITKEIAKCHAAFARIAVISAISAIYNTLGLILFFHHFMVFKLLIMPWDMFFLIVVGLQEKDFKRIKYMICILTGLAALTVGIWQFFLEEWPRFGKIWAYIITILCLFLIKLGKKTLTHINRENGYRRRVTISYHKKTVTMDGFADSGNHLQDPCTGKPVCVIVFDSLKEVLEEQEAREIGNMINLSGVCFENTKGQIRYIPYRSLGNSHGILPIMEIDCMSVENKGENAVFYGPLLGIIQKPFASPFHYSILLHQDYC